MAVTGRKIACIDKGRKEKKEFIAGKRPEPPLKHTIQRYQDVFDKLGFQAPMSFTDIFEFIPKDFKNLNPL
jgi:hypothetical protein